MTAATTVFSDSKENAVTQAGGQGNTCDVSLDSRFRGDDGLM